MSLLLGMFLATQNEAKTESQHAYNTRSYKENFHDLNLFFKQARAKAILFALGIL